MPEATPPHAATTAAPSAPDAPHAHIDVPGYTGPERRSEFRLWRESIERRLSAVDKRLDEGRATMTGLRTELDENTRATNAVKADTSELVEVLNGAKGAFKVLNWIGNLARPIGAIAAAGAAVLGLWVAVKNGTPPGGLK